MYVIMEWNRNSQNKLPINVLILLLAKISVSSVRHGQKWYRHCDKPSSSSISDSSAAGICFMLLGSNFSAVSISVLVLNPNHTYSPSSFLHSTSNLDLVDSGITPEKNRIINIKWYQRLQRKVAPYIHHWQWQYCFQFADYDLQFNDPCKPKYWLTEIYHIKIKIRPIVV